jgi:dCTP diphosphatase
MNDAAPDSEIERFRRRLRAFADVRDWDRFHAPKNLAMAMIVEAAELVEHFQWLTEAESSALDSGKLEAVALELADIQIYLIRLADKLGIDLMQAVERKIAINEHRYPAERVRGSSKKYSEYD